jgi:hypothetical protein
MPKRLWILPVIALTGISVWFGTTLIHRLRLERVGHIMFREDIVRAQILELLYDHMASFKETHSRWPRTLEELALDYPDTNDLLNRAQFTLDKFIYDPTAHGHRDRILVHDPGYYIPGYQRIVVSNGIRSDLFRPVLLGTGAIERLQWFTQEHMVN